MRVISQSELLRATRFELNVMLRRIAADLPHLPEGSHELRIAQYNLYNIRVALAQGMCNRHRKGRAARATRPGRTGSAIPSSKGFF
jgi:hypothetical protein